MRQYKYFCSSCFQHERSAYSWWLDKKYYTECPYCKNELTVYATCSNRNHEEWIPLKDFHSNKQNLDEHHSECKVCRGIKRKKYVADNKDYIAAYNKYYWKNK